ncbi:MAG: flavin reductase family protein [Proteobacteria bacterium]|nr:flavin reductase family protein [Pseudomonadota bacterium]
MVNQLDLKVLRDMSYGLYVLTSYDEDYLNGQIINSVNQVTNDPVRLAVTINKKNLTHDLILKSKVFAVSVLDNSTPKSFFQLFGFMSGRDVDKLAHVKHKEGITGCPVVLENALSVLEAVVFKEVDLGSHTVFIGNAVASEVLEKGHSLTYRYYQETLNGRISKNAPTYIPA